MTPTPEATEALAKVLWEQHWSVEHNGRVTGAPPNHVIAAVLAALPPGTVPTTVDEVAQRLCITLSGDFDACPRKELHRAEAKRLLGVTE